MGKVNKQNVIARSNDYYGTTDTLQYTYRRLLPRQTTATGSNDLRSHTTIRGVDILMEQHGGRKRSTDFRRGRRLGQRDHLIVIDKPKKQPDWMSAAQYEAAPASLTVRECAVADPLLTKPRGQAREEVASTVFSFSMLYPIDRSRYLY